MRADWDTAPDWAGFVAQEMSGSLYWHEFEPRFVEVTGEWRSKGRTLIVPKVDRAAQDTLERRPETFKGIPPKFDNYNVLSRTFEIFYSGEYDQGPFNWIQPNVQQK